ncbi:hypothetical protein [Sulfuricurvum sp.]|uniref:hypothetical protein n=1 Tax=Sulfuricurvum sp. TaxID=2025608 RepID=UPI003BB49CC9
MFLSFLSRFYSSTSKKSSHYSEDEYASLKKFTIKERGEFFQNFNLFHYGITTPIDTLIFLPHYGIYFGETLSWKVSDLENATIEHSSLQKKRSSETHLENIESKIRAKLQDVLSFDFTPVYRFIWMRYLSENEFDLLDTSFHELLPKNRILFYNESINSIQSKLQAIGHYLQIPLSTLQIIGALKTHSYILPTSENQSGALLSPQQNEFLTLPLEKRTHLFGGYGTGKSTLLIRKAMFILLNQPNEKIVVFAPTLLASELLRNEFVSLMYYGVLNIDLIRIVFSSVQEDLESFKPFQDATIIICDDIDRMNTYFIKKLQQKAAKRILLFTSLLEDTLADINYPLSYTYRNPLPTFHLKTNEKGVLPTLLLELRKYTSEQGKRILIVLTENRFISLYKESIDEYLGVNIHFLTPTFSLQSQNFDDLIITTDTCLSGLSASHVFIISTDYSQDYSYPLSRALETATIITYSNSQAETQDAENHKE